MIKVIAFDFSGVILKSFSSDEKMLHVKKSSQTYKKYLEISNKMDLGQIDQNEAEILISELSGIPIENIWNDIYLTSKLNTKLVEIIKHLKFNYKILIFSNYMSYYLNKLLIHNGIYNLFNDKIISSDFGLVKPDPKFYEILVEKSGVNKNEIVFVDDKLINIEAANKFGIRSFIFTNTDELIDDFKSIGINTEN